MAADDVEPFTRTTAGEQVETTLEPLAEPVRDFERFVDGVVGGVHAVDGLPAAGRREVTVQLDQRYAARHQFGTVDLDFEVVLRAGGSCAAEQANQGRRRHSHAADSNPQNSPACVPR